MAKEYKNNIFDVLKSLDNKDYSYYSSLSEEQQKDIQPYTISRWMSSIAGNEFKHEKFNFDINNFVNRHFWELSKYKDLQMLLLASCGQPGWNKHQWVPLCKNTPKDKNYTILREAFNEKSDNDFNDLYNSLDEDDIKEFVKMLSD